MLRKSSIVVTFSQTSLGETVSSSYSRKNSFSSQRSSPPAFNKAKEEENLVGSVHMEKIEIRFQNLSYSVEKEGEFLHYSL